MSPHYPPDLPTLSQDVLEAVPEWGAALAQQLDTIQIASSLWHTDISERCSKIEECVADLEVSRTNMIRTYDGELDELQKHVALLEKIFKELPCDNHNERVAKLEAREDD